MSPRRVSRVQMSLILRDSALATCTQQNTRVPSTLTDGARCESGGGDERNQRRNRAVECPENPLDIAQSSGK